MDHLPEMQEVVVAVPEETQLAPMQLNGEEPVVEPGPEVANAEGQTHARAHAQYQMYVHAPQYHWHMHASTVEGLDANARTTIERLHLGMHQFA